MKKNYTTVLLLFVLNCCCSFGSWAQAPVANNDEQFNFENSCAAIIIDVLANDILYSPIDSNTIDLDPSQPGVQQTIIGSFGSQFQVIGQYVYVFTPGLTPVGIPQTISYVIVDNLGNTSNIATISVSHIPTIANASYINPDCDAMNGQIVIDGLFLDSDATLMVYKDSVMIGQYTIPAFQSEYTVTGLSPGFYNIDITLSCGFPIFTTINNFYLEISNPIIGSVTDTYNDFNNDGIVNVGDIINYQASVTNTSATCVLNDVQLTASNVSIASLAPNATDASTLNYYHIITQDDVNLGNALVYHTITVSNPGVVNTTIAYTNTLLNTSNGIKLNAFIDTNNNGIQDGNEQNYTHGTFSYQINSGAVHDISTSTGEFYLYETNPENIYSLQYTINTINNYCGSHYLVAIASYPSIAVANGSGVTTYNFAITPVACDDVSVYLYSDRNPRPGFVYTNYIYYTNEGNQSASGTITFNNDSAVTLLSNSVGAPMNATGFSYDYTNLLPGESRFITITMQVPVIPTVTLGQSLSNSVTITPTDGNSQNNSATLTRNISGSYDPNEKTESHGDKIVYANFTANDYLTYTIRFENTGNAEAINIQVNDILDAKLDETTVKMVRASNAYVLDRVGNALSWRFDGINLPPSVVNDEVTGHGYIVFQVKPKTGFALGDIIPNTANIYFDFNPAIVTNTCTTEFVPFLGVNVFDATTFQYYPNPTSSIVTFSLKNNTAIDTIEVMDILGKTVLSKVFHYSNATIDLSSLSKGIYLAKVKTNGQEKIVKLTKV